MTHLGQTTLTVFTGPMFSAKTERLITELNRFGYAKSRIKVGKPAIDTRSSDFIASRRIRDGVPEVTDRIEATPIMTFEDFLAFTAGDEYDVLAFDEAQFFPLDEPFDSLGWFGRGIRELLHRRRDSSLQILIAGLDTTSADQPFGVMPGLLALADEVVKLAAVCMSCNSIIARKSHNVAGDPATVRVGDLGVYEARCRSCFVPS